MTSSAVSFRLVGSLLALGIGCVGAPMAQASVTQIEGAAGGGVVPWAFIASAQTASLTWVNTGDFNLLSAALQMPLITDRLEVSYARQSLDIVGPNTAAVVRSLGDNNGTIDMDVIGAKMRLLGMSDALPAVSAGIQYKKTSLDQGVMNAIGSADDSGIDFYLAATKVYGVTAENKLLLAGNLRYTKANQIGLLGFGGTSGNDDGYSLQYEATAGFFAKEDVVAGVEYRSRPDNLSSFKEDDIWDLWVAYLPSEYWSAVLAYASLGDIVAEAADLGDGTDVPEGEDQRGLYLQIQANF